MVGVVQGVIATTALSENTILSPTDNITRKTSESADVFLALLFHLLNQNTFVASPLPQGEQGTLVVPSSESLAHQLYDLRSSTPIDTTLSIPINSITNFSGVESQSSVANNNGEFSLSLRVCSPLTTAQTQFIMQNHLTQSTIPQLAIAPMSPPNLEPSEIPGMVPLASFETSFVSTENQAGFLAEPYLTEVAEPYLIKGLNLAIASLVSKSFQRDEQELPVELLRTPTQPGVIIGLNYPKEIHEGVPQNSLSSDSITLPQPISPVGAIPETENLATFPSRQSLVLLLEPPSLGKLRIDIQRTRDELTVKFTTPSIEVRDILRNEVATLKTALHEQGLELSNVEVGQFTHGERGTLFDAFPYYENVNTNQFTHQADEYPENNTPYPRQVFLTSSPSQSRGLDLYV